MADRPILFSGPMVRAILEGRKTQTRRVIKLAGCKPDYIGPRGCTHDPSCWGWEDSERGDYWLLKRGEGDKGRLDWSDWIGAYRVGDRLWVREKWQGLSFGDYQPTKSRTCDLRYAAADTLADADKSVRGYPWRPSIHMPRWASRLTLHVTDVCVQRLQDISEEDARAEGVETRQIRPVYDIGQPAETWWFGTENGRATGKSAFRDLWDSLNAERAPWASNPWVCAVSFEAREINIDRMEAE
ncbi:hypothetical protein JWJ88_08605 [Paracoccus methylovorus]|uniref:Morphogenetic protein n=1 Tax=Paracoccus methylovorus TaxID=2812658 RepID=A0ABX7JIF4_9RHOB|nr:hypothetical protein [Paracoccus methylovorus]QRZ12669.1 hypothetical protein JWJ88_08605 [Paracoccus methylovorus]